MIGEIHSLVAEIDILLFLLLRILSVTYCFMVSIDFSFQSIFPCIT